MKVKNTCEMSKYTEERGQTAMANQEHLDILGSFYNEGRYRTFIEGFWNTWREKHPDIQPDLSGADLSRVYARRVNFANTNLSGANLSAAMLPMARFYEADLTQANLSGIDLSASVISRREDKEYIIEEYLG